MTRSAVEKYSDIQQRDYQLVVIGSSIDVQHMAHGFTENFAKWLGSHVDLKIKSTVHGETLLLGVAYFASDYAHSFV